MKIQAISFNKLNFNNSKLSSQQTYPKYKQITMDDVFEEVAKVPKSSAEIILKQSEAKKAAIVAFKFFAPNEQRAEKIYNRALKRINLIKENGFKDESGTITRKINLDSKGQLVSFYEKNEEKSYSAFVEIKDDKPKKITITRPDGSKDILEYCSEGKLTKLAIKINEENQKTTAKRVYNIKYKSIDISQDVEFLTDGTTKISQKFNFSLGGKLNLIFKNLSQNQNSQEYAELYRYKQGIFDSAILNHKVNLITGKEEYQEYDRLGKLIKQK